MEKETDVNPDDSAREVRYELRIQPTGDPGELRKLPYWYYLPVLIPIFIWMAMPAQGPIWFASAATLLLFGTWALLRTERNMDSTNVDRELKLYILTALAAGFALASWLFLLVVA
ncbi:MAG: hypothetical protein IT365_05020 [Candidatus Hydrogenedentes bacterium]|nr:hypothetical protein [Candidatus Hydrogenedentota bacterium]